MINLLGRRYLFFILSLVLIVPGLILALMGLNLSIDFTGGSILEVSFASGELPQPAEVVKLFTDLGIKDPLVQTTDQKTLVLRFSFLDEIDENTRQSVITGQALADAFDNEVTVLRFDSVGPTVGREVAGRAALAVAIAAAAGIVFISYFFIFIFYPLSS